MKKFILKSLLIFLIVPLQSNANDYTVTVRGHVFGVDPSRSTVRFPLVGLKIELVDSDADGSQLFDDVMGTAIVNTDGSFVVTGKGGDPGSYSWSKPDVYIRFVYNYKDKVRLTDELNRTRYTNTPEHDHDNFEGSLDIGTWTIGLDVGTGEGSMCGIWYQVCRAWDEYVAIMGEEPKPGFCDIEYWSAIFDGTPWTNDNTIHWPTHYTSRAAAHEFGHIIRHSFDGDRNHFNWDVTRFRYARYHSPCADDCNNWSTESSKIREAFAFNEGWAEFWSREYVCAQKYSYECEGGVATILKDIELNLTNAGKQARKTMCQVLKNNPGSIHSIRDFINKLNAMPGVATYNLVIPKKITPVDRSKLVTPAPISKSTGIRAANEKAEIISTVIKKMPDQKTRRLASFSKPCKGNGCDYKAQSILDAVSYDHKSALLTIQRNMTQTQNSNPFFDTTREKKGNNTSDEFMAKTKRNYNDRILSANQESCKKAISELHMMKNNLYASALAEELAAKMKALKSGNMQLQLSFDQTATETARKSNQ